MMIAVCLGAATNLVASTSACRTARSHAAAAVRSWRDL